MLHPHTNWNFPSRSSPFQFVFDCWHAVCTARSFRFRQSLHFAPSLFKWATRFCSRLIHQTSTSTFISMNIETIQHRSFLCPICGAAFHRLFELKNHNRVHTNERPYQCNNGCGKAFRWRSCVHYHTKNGVCTKRANRPSMPQKKERPKAPTKRQTDTPNTVSSAAVGGNTLRSSSRTGESSIVRTGYGTEGMLFNLGNFMPFSDPLSHR